jgi:hypothetical protein
LSIQPSLSSFSPSSSPPYQTIGLAPTRNGIGVFSHLIKGDNEEIKVRGSDLFFFNLHQQRTTD